MKGVPEKSREVPMGFCPQVLLIPGAWSWLGGSHHRRWSVEVWTNAAVQRSRAGVVLNALYFSEGIFEGKRKGG